MKLQLFNGGQNTRLASHLIRTNEAVTFKNIDNEDGTLKPIKKLLAAGNTHTDEDIYSKSSDSIVTLAKTPTSHVEFGDDIYYSVASDLVQMKASGSEGDLGLDAPEITDMSAAQATLSAPVAGDVTISDYTVPGTNPDWYDSTKTYYFAITEIDSSGRESPALELTYSPTATGGTAIQIQVNNGKTLRIYLAQWAWLGGATKVYKALTDYVGLENMIFFGFGDFVPGRYYPLPTKEERLADYSYIKNVTGTITLYRPYQQTSTFYQTKFPAKVGETGYEDADGDWLITFDPTTIQAATSGFDADTYTYVAVVESTTLGWKSTQSAPGQITLPANYFIELTIDMIVSDSRINKLTVYRIGADLTDFTRVHVVNSPVFPYTFTDRVLDSAVAGKQILSNEEDFDKLEQNLENLLVVNNQLCGTIDNKLYFSLRGKFYAMTPGNFRTFEEDIVSLYNIDAGLIVCSATKTWLLNTSNLLVGKIIKISDEFGSLSHQAMVGYLTGCMWASAKGIVVSFGGKVELITKEQLGYTNLAITHAYMFNESYFGFTAQGVCYVVDMRYGGVVFKEFEFTLFSDSDANTIVRQVYEDGGVLKVLFGTTTATDEYTVFGGTDSETLTWLSPEFIEGSLTELKTYKNIYVSATADVNFKVYLDGELVHQQYFYEEDVYDIKVPQEKQQATKIQFEVSGTGTLKEIEYKAMGRKNGR